MVSFQACGNVLHTQHVFIRSRICALQMYPGGVADFVLGALPSLSLFKVAVSSGSVKAFGE